MIKFKFVSLKICFSTWPLTDNQEINDPMEKLFVDSFNELGLSQCINVPTHIKGRTLDLLVTNIELLNNY